MLFFLYEHSRFLLRLYHIYFIFIFVLICLPLFIFQFIFCWKNYIQNVNEYVCALKINSTLPGFCDYMEKTIPEHAGRVLSRKNYPLLDHTVLFFHITRSIFHRKTLVTPRSKQIVPSRQSGTNLTSSRLVSNLS